MSRSQRRDSARGEDKKDGLPTSLSKLSSGGIGPWCAASTPGLGDVGVTPGCWPSEGCYQKHPQWTGRQIPRDGGWGGVKPSQGDEKGLQLKQGSVLGKELHPPFLLNPHRDLSDNAPCPERGEGAAGRGHHLFPVSKVQGCRGLTLLKLEFKGVQVPLNSIRLGSG